MRPAASVLALAVFAGLAACGPASRYASVDPGGTGSAEPADAGETPDTSDAGEADVTRTYPAESPPVPMVVTLGGPVLATPKIVPVFFASDDGATVASVSDFVRHLGASDYWKAAVAEYGVGAAIAASPVSMPPADDPGASIDDATIQTWLTGKLEAGDTVFPAPDAQTVYLLFYPAGVTVTNAGAQGCAAFTGYHQETALDAAHGNARVAYAVVPRCGTASGVTGLDALTAVASHELAEAVTDPFPATAPAFLQVDDAHFYWTEVLGGSEVGDLCAHVDGAVVPLDEGPYRVQRVWSNAAARAGQDPCVPAPVGRAYFNAAPALGVVATTVQGRSVQIDGVRVAVGGSAVISLHLFSDAPTAGPWIVSARPAAGWTGELAFSFDTASGVDGDVVSMTVRVLGAGKYDREPFVVTSSL
ncbi:MAG TPA: hypothetical protein VIF09_18765, partial [Polyangiaceae bacterium]